MDISDRVMASAQEQASLTHEAREVWRRDHALQRAITITMGCGGDIEGTLAAARLIEAYLFGGDALLPKTKATD